MGDYFYHGISLTFLQNEAAGRQEWITRHPIYITLQLLSQKIYLEQNRIMAVNRRLYQETVERRLSWEMERIRSEYRAVYQDLRNLRHRIDTTSTVREQNSLQRLLSMQMKRIRGLDGSALTQEERLILENRDFERELSGPPLSMEERVLLFRNVIENADSARRQELTEFLTRIYRTDTPPGERTGSNHTDYNQTNINMEANPNGDSDTDRDSDTDININTDSVRTLEILERWQEAADRGGERQLIRSSESHRVQETAAEEYVRETQAAVREQMERQEQLLREYIREISGSRGSSGAGKGDSAGSREEDRAGFANRREEGMPERTAGEKVSVPALWSRYLERIRASQASEPLPISVQERTLLFRNILQDASSEERREFVEFLNRRKDAAEQLPKQDGVRVAETVQTGEGIRGAEDIISLLAADPGKILEILERRQGMVSVPVNREEQEGQAAEMASKTASEAIRNRETILREYALETEIAVQEQLQREESLLRAYIREIVERGPEGTDRPTGEFPQTGLLPREAEPQPVLWERYLESVRHAESVQPLSVEERTLRFLNIVQNGGGEEREEFRTFLNRMDASRGTGGADGTEAGKKTADEPESLRMLMQKNPGRMLELLERRQEQEEAFRQTSRQEQLPERAGALIQTYRQEGETIIREELQRQEKLLQSYIREIRQDAGLTAGFSGGGLFQADGNADIANGSPGSTDSSPVGTDDRYPVPALWKQYEEELLARRNIGRSMDTDGKTLLFLNLVQNSSQEERTEFRRFLNARSQNGDVGSEENLTVLMQKNPGRLLELLERRQKETIRHETIQQETAARQYIREAETAMREYIHSREQRMLQNLREQEKSLEMNLGEVAARAPEILEQLRSRETEGPVFQERAEQILLSYAGIFGTEQKILPVHTDGQKEGAETPAEQPAYTADGLLTSPAWNEIRRLVLEGSAQAEAEEAGSERGWGVVTSAELGRTQIRRTEELRSGLLVYVTGRPEPERQELFRTIIETARAAGSDSAADRTAVQTARQRADQAADIIRRAGRRELEEIFRRVADVLPLEEQELLLEILTEEQRREARGGRLLTGGQIRTFVFSNQEILDRPYSLVCQKRELLDVICHGSAAELYRLSSYISGGRMLDRQLIPEQNPEGIRTVLYRQVYNLTDTQVEDVTEHVARYLHEAVRQRQADRRTRGEPAAPSLIWQQPVPAIPGYGQQAANEGGQTDFGILSSTVQSPHPAYMPGNSTLTAPSIVYKTEEINEQEIRHSDEILQRQIVTEQEETRRQVSRQEQKVKKLTEQYEELERLKTLVEEQSVQVRELTRRQMSGSEDDRMYREMVKRMERQLHLERQRRGMD